MNRLTLTIVLVLITTYPFLWSQSLDYSGPVSTSLAFTKVFDTSPWASLGNVANLSDASQLEVGAAYQMRFNMEELSARAATFIAPSRYGVFSGLVYQSGYSKSNFSRYGLAYSRMFGANIKAGFQFNYLSHHVESADRADAFYSSVGLGFRLSESFELGVFIQNPEQGKISYSDSEYALPTSFNTAVKYSITSRFMAVVEVDKPLDNDLVYKTALQFDFKDKLFVRGGVKGQPVELTFGGGIYVEGLAIDIGFAHHQQLGMTSAAGISYSFKQRQK